MATIFGVASLWGEIKTLNFQAAAGDKYSNILSSNIYQNAYLMTGSGAHPSQNNSCQRLCYKVSRETKGPPLDLRRGGPGDLSHHPGDLCHHVFCFNLHLLWMCATNGASGLTTKTRGSWPYY